MITGMEPDQGVNMTMPVDRPYPVDYVHPNGKEAKVDFIWGRSNDDVPVGVRVWVQDGDDDLLLVKEAGNWSSFEEARQFGIDLAMKWFGKFSPS
ncbi:hypothetical protein V2K50_11235 [Pseudomonas alliivorans]|nr:hypothetical protein [Pseudomonas alliivorans]